MQITEHIHALKMPFLIAVGPEKTIERFVYVYILMGKEICLIDSGVKNSYETIFAYLDEHGRKPEDISLLVLTHAHPDHIGSARTVKERTKCLVAAHSDAQAWIEDVELQVRERPVPGFHALVGGSTAVDRLLQDGETVFGKTLPLEVIDTPGHATGAISFYCKEQAVLFAGDAVPQPNDLPIYEDAAAAAASLQRLKGLPSVNFLLASWAEPAAGSEAADKMLDDGLEYLQRIHEEVLDIAARGKTDSPMELCARMVERLGLPKFAVNPLLAKSFISHLKIRDRKSLL